MKTAGKAVAWVCIFSTTFMGCYTSALIDPRGTEKDKIYSGRIESVTMNDGREYVFDPSPTTVDDSIVGIVKGKQVSIPLSDVIYQKEEPPRHTCVIVEGGRTYLFENGPVVLNDSIIGMLNGNRASLLISDVEKVEVRDLKLSESATFALISVGSLALIALALFAALSGLKGHGV